MKPIQLNHSHNTGYFMFGVVLLLSALVCLEAKAWDSSQWNPSQKAAKVAQLNPRQKDVTQDAGTEPPFHNEYWNNHSAGIYVDVVTGEPLFSSLDKYDSGTGWPSFTRTITKNATKENDDHELAFETRTEVRSKLGDSHLGHVFPDGPAPTGQRFCMNSAAMRFIPAADLQKSGYGEYAPLFQKKSSKHPE